MHFRFTGVSRLVRMFTPKRSDITWIVPGSVIACRYPRQPRDLERVAQFGVVLLVNLHERPHAPMSLAQLGLRELHLPVSDFTPPSLQQLRIGVEAIAEAVGEGECVAVHCGAGLGRTGTLLACYLVSLGEAPDAAIDRIRSLRPGAIETHRQEQAIHNYASTLQPGDDHSRGSTTGSLP